MIEKLRVLKLPASQPSQKCILWNIPWDVSCEMMSFCGLMELGYMMLENIKQVSLLQLLWTFNGLRVSFQ